MLIAIFLQVWPKHRHHKTRDILFVLRHYNIDKMNTVHFYCNHQCFKPNQKNILKENQESILPIHGFDEIILYKANQYELNTSKL